MYKTASLSPDILNIIHDKDTEPAFSGDYNNTADTGSYLCRQCGVALFRSSSKFLSTCGWPSFDDEIAERILRTPDPDGRRTEILCKNCNAHLGHIFFGESYTENNQRYCINSAAIDFVTSEVIITSQEAIFAAGCFWGLQYYFDQIDDVIKTQVGYIGGDLPYPSYQAVCTGNSGHVEAIRVIFDSDKINYEMLCKYFFEIHDATQSNGQGVDIGSQYLSKIFYYDQYQQETALSLMNLLKQRSYDITTQILPVTTFWPAEIQHQQYYDRQDTSPPCHSYKKLFD